jgi:hypothetical protein
MDGSPKSDEIKRELGVVSQGIKLDQSWTVHKNLERHCRYFPFRAAKPSNASMNGWLCSSSGFHHLFTDADDVPRLYFLQLRHAARSLEYRGLVAADYLS